MKYIINTQTTRIHVYVFTTHFNTTATGCNSKHNGCNYSIYTHYFFVVIIEPIF